MIYFEPLKTRTIKILNHDNLSTDSKALTRYNIHSLDKIRNNSSSDPFTHAFDEKHKLFFGPKHDFSIKVSPK
jgi:hypothetical protein